MINSDARVYNYIYSIGKPGEPEYYYAANKSSANNNFGIDGRKDWNIDTKKENPAVGELGDEIVYKVVVANYAKANVYVHVKDIIPTNVQITSITPSGTQSGNEINWKFIKVKQGQGYNQDPTEVTLIVKGIIRTRNYEGAESKATIGKGESEKKDGGVYATNSSTYLMKQDDRYTRIRTDYDYLITRKYDISIDNYISQVHHQETRGGTGITYQSDSRKEQEDNSKLNDPVFVEYGDVITYQLVLYNAHDPWVSNGSTPYYSPGEVYVDFDYELPKKYQLRDILSTNSYDKYEEKNGRLEFKDVKIDRDRITTITVVLVAEEVQKDIEETTEMRITRCYNRNHVPNGGSDSEIENLSGRTTSQERYKISHYDAILDEYIFTYNAEMAEYNDTYAFTDGESNQKYVEENRTYSNKSPLEVEKYETLCYKTIVTNNYKNAEGEDTPESYKQYNTRIRPTIVKQTIDYGLTQYQYQIWWHHASSGRDELVSDDRDQSRIVQTLRDTDSKWVYEYEILDEEIILSPGDYLYYLSFVEVTESNMSLRNLEFKSEIKELTNINRKNKFNISHNGEVIAHTSNMKNDKAELISIEQTNPSENSDLIFTFKIRDICNTIENENCKKGICFGYATPTGTGCKVNMWKENGQRYCSVQIHLGDRGSNHETRMVTDENVAKPNHVSRNNFVRLKDLIISGTVWVDENRDGKYKDGEKGKNDVKVTLYSNYYSDRKDEEGNDILEYHGNNYKKVDEKYTSKNKKTNSDGYYNFGRRLKAQQNSNGNYINEHIKYFVEFEYYGMMWKATEVYGGMNTGETYGKGNLSIGNNAKNETISYWRQGYRDLPTSESEKVIQRKDLGLDRKNGIYDRL